MKILIVSDTHGRHQALDRALEEAGKIDMFFHQDSFVPKVYK